MKETRASFALLFFIIAAHIAYLLPQAGLSSEITQSYAATICPSAIGDARLTNLLPSKNSLIRELSQPNAKLRKNGQGSYSISKNAVFVDGNPTNVTQIQSKAGRWTAALTCESSSQTSWFVGGTANVTSQSKLILVNSGLGDAIVDVTSFSENGRGATVPITIKASSEKVVRVDSFDPGTNQIVLKVETRSGRVVAYLLDERVRGLNNIGADFVAPITKPEPSLVIASLPIRYGGNNKAAHTVRIMSAGQVDADVSIEVVSPEGVFIPVGFDDIKIGAQQVRDLDLSEVDLGNKTFALKITSSVPVVAGVITTVKSGSVSDFMWSAPSQSFGNVALNLYGLEPTVTFVAERIQVDVNWRNNSGKQFSKSLIGDEVLSWKVPPNTRLISFTNKTGSKAAMNWISRDGVTHLPLTSGTKLESASKPIADIAVIQPTK
ncbi:MAG: hypothetical protein FGM47_01880 [Candidatus Nanopelagicaceae bacterium]|nr:hypothetical protein [Candidatus Nanopelagicaceae bacterium]